MKNRSLHFSSLTQLVSFSKVLCGGYLLNTMKLTLTACIPDSYVELAIKKYDATPIEPSGNLYSFDNGRGNSIDMEY